VTSGQGGVQPSSIEEIRGLKSKPEKRICLVVLGMHRSGTSALTRVLSIAGAKLPENLNAAGGGNDLGYWESDPLINYHEALLAELGSSWSDWRKLELGHIPVKRRNEIKEEIAGIVASEFGDAPLIVIKEPRICRFAPLFIDALQEAGFECRCVLPLRSPLEVVQSLERRDGMSRGKAALLWLRHVLDAEEASREHLRSFTAFDRLMSNWRESLAQTTKHLRVGWPYAENEIANQVEAFLTPSERHHATTTEQVLLDPMLRGWVADVYTALQVLENNPMSAPALAVLDRVRGELNHASPIIEHLLAEADARRATEVAELDTTFQAARAELNASLDAARAAQEAAQTEANAAIAAAIAAREEADAAHAAADVARTEADALARAVEAERIQAVEAHAQATAARRQAELDRTTTAEALAAAGVARSEVEALKRSLSGALEQHRIMAERASAAEFKFAEASRDLANLRTRQVSLEEQDRAAKRRIAELSAETAGLRTDVARLDALLADRAAAIQALQAASAAEVSRLRDVIAQRDMHLHAMGSSTSWKLTRPIRGAKRLFVDAEFRRQLPYRVARSAARRIGVPVMWRARAKALAAKLGWIYTGQPVVIAPSPAPATASALQIDTRPVAARPEAKARESRYSILWVVNDSDLQTQKYRVLNYASELAHHNVRSLIVREAELNGVDPAGHDIVVFNRIAANDRTAALIARCKELGIPTRYDVDDLVFDEHRLNLLRFTASLSPDEFKLFRDGCVSRRDLLLQCDYVTCSTAELAREVRALGRTAYVLPNTIGRADLEEFGASRPLRQMSKPARVRIAYFSGTRTHAHDFACCADALVRVLRDNRNTELLIVGELDLPASFNGLRDRIITKPLMSHADMLRELADVDINLAPLELGNPFTACKSELKIFEAAIFAVPSVASPTPTFAAIIQHGETGMLASTEEEWYSAIERLTNNALRRRIGDAAKAQIVPRFDIATAVEEAITIDEAIINKRSVSFAAPAVSAAQRAATQPLMTVVAILYNKRSEVRFFLEALRRQDFAGPFEVLLVDDCTADDSVEVVRDYERNRTAGAQMTLRILRNEKNMGNCASRNRALAEAKGDVVVIVDADCMLNHSYLSDHFRAHAHGDCDAAIGPMNIETNGLPALSVLGRYEADAQLAAANAAMQDTTNADHFVNCVTRNFSISKRFVAERLNDELFDNLFAYSRDPQSGFGWEDVEMGCRLYKAGARIRNLPSTISIHVSHPSTTDERTKPLRSLKNFRRLHEKHPDLILLARQWSITTYNAILGWVAHNGLDLKTNDDACYLEGVFSRYQKAPIAITKPKRLRVLTHRWHCPHQYELYRSGHDFTLVTGAGTGLCDSWEWDKRPMPANARFVRRDDIDPRDYDVALVHFDENALHPERCHGKVPMDWGATLNWFVREMPLPMIGICHGTPQFAGQYDGNYAGADLGKVNEASRQELVNYLKDIFVVCNSHQARDEWGFARSRTIWHGFSPHEYPNLAHNGRVLTMLGAALDNRPHYNGKFVVQRIEELLGRGVVHPLHVPEPPQSYAKGGRDWAESKFRNYARAVGAYSAYLNPTLRSPMPRSRGEAMLLGLVSVSMRNHDVDLFIRNGENGFFGDSADELAEQLAYLIKNPDAAARIGEASRRTAADLFNQDRYLSDWAKLFTEVAG